MSIEGCGTGTLPWACILSLRHVVLVLIPTKDHQMYHLSSITLGAPQVRAMLKSLLITKYRFVQIFEQTALRFIESQ